MALDFNALERAAKRAKQDGRYRDALRIYYFMSDGDPSLDAGYLGERIAECYEALNDIPAARYWYGRAVEENPEAHVRSADARERLGNDDYNALLALGA
jgi:tetratricopeptide (TPR) repeat protein